MFIVSPHQTFRIILEHIRIHALTSTKIHHKKLSFQKKDQKIGLPHSIKQTHAHMHTHSHLKAIRSWFWPQGFEGYTGQVKPEITLLLSSSTYFFIKLFKLREEKIFLWYDFIYPNHTPLYSAGAISLRPSKV